MFEGICNEDETYNFEILRALSHIPGGGGDTAEVLSVAQRIVAGDDDSWFSEWQETASAVAELAAGTSDPTSRGLAELRASNYWRTAEFFLHGDDERLLPTFRASVDCFRSGLETLGVEAEYLDVAYDPVPLSATWYPAPRSNEGPVLMIGGGYDSTEEELWFAFVAAARDRGYDCATYSGPGQGAVIRERGLPLTYEWEKPVAAVLDTIADRVGGRPIVLIGWSLGGFLAPRAAAFDPRIDAVVAHNVFFDFYDAVVPDPAMRAQLEAGEREAVNALAAEVMRDVTQVRWALNHGCWVLECDTPFDCLRRLPDFSLKGVANKVTCDVFVTAGAEDHFVPLSQLNEFEQALTNARSVSSHIYDERFGGGTHCQLGATHLWQRDLFDWLPTLPRNTES